MATHELVVPKSMPMILPMFFSGKSKKCLNETEVGAVGAISRPKWLNLHLFALFWAESGCFLLLKVLFWGCDRDQSRAQYAICNEVALLQNGYHCVGFLLGRDHTDGLMMVRIKLGASGRVDFNHLVAL